ncbi:structural toxin protein RtxA [Thelonectria olida]|uniref:ATP phosphoribosyltransferase n=1 Tax=Thelonectria olida TaxID=1576542 RepID=A0A9P9AT89_9HYPO|nr:structural toxin protein RtxA [Thelonectria olida]
MANPTQFKLIFRVPPSHLEACKEAVFAAGAGTYPGGLYTHVSFETLGMDQFRPSENSTPFIGSPGQLEKVEEYRVETLCVGEDVMRSSVKALRKAHPYQQVVVEVIQLVDVGED